MDLNDQLNRLELASDGRCVLSPEACEAIAASLRAGLMLYAFIMERSQGKNLPCVAWERATVARAQQCLIPGCPHEEEKPVQADELQPSGRCAV